MERNLIPYRSEPSGLTVPALPWSISFPRKICVIGEIPMKASRIAMASVGAFGAYFVLGGLAFTLLPLRNEFMKYPAIYRNQEAMKTVMPGGMAAMLVAMVMLALLYAMLYRGGSGAVEGARFGVLIGVFSVCSFVIHNYVNLNIGLKLTIEQAVAYLVEWLVVGIVIGLIYRPAR